MPPQTRARGKQQDVSKVEVDRGTPAAQEKRQSSCLHKLSLSGASNNPDPNSGAAGIKQEGRDSSMPPRTRARGKQQDVAKLEVNQVQRGKPAAQEKRRSSRLQNLSLSGASTQLDPKSGGESKRRKTTISESSLPLCKSTKSKNRVRCNSGVESNKQPPPSSSAPSKPTASQIGKSSMRNQGNCTKTLATSVSVEKKASSCLRDRGRSSLSFVKRSGFQRDTAHRMAVDEVNNLSLESSLPAKKTNSVDGVSNCGGNRSSMPAVIEFDIQTDTVDQVESHSNDTIVMAPASPVLKDGYPLIRLPFSSPRLYTEKEAPLISSTPTRGNDTGIVGISPLPKLDGSGNVNSVSSPSAPQPGWLSPTRNYLKDASFSSTDVIPFGATSSVTPMEKSDKVDSFHPKIEDCDLSFDVDSLLEGPMSEELEMLRDIDVDSFFAQVALCTNDAAASASYQHHDCHDHGLVDLIKCVDDGNSPCYATAFVIFLVRRAIIVSFGHCP